MEEGRPRRTRAAWAAPVVAVIVGLAILAAFGGPGPAQVVIPAAVVLAAGAVVVASLVRGRRRAAEHERRLEAWAAERAVRDERLRIARELHDLASHGLGLITLRAAAAGRATGEAADAERRSALTDIERAARGSTAELRRMLGVLRAPGADDPSPLRPAPGFGDLGALAAAARDGGLDVELVPDDPAASPDLAGTSPGVQLVVCAVVREGLANARRHAGATAVRVAVERRGSTVVVEVVDAGPVDGWIPEPGAGLGLAGLRERAELVGGRFRAEPAGEGYRIVAGLPDGSAS